jgi:hypothetical protein
VSSHLPWARMAELRHIRQNALCMYYVAEGDTALSFSNSLLRYAKESYFCGDS